MLLLRWMSRWPLWLLHALGAPLGWLVWALSPTYRRRLRENAALAGVSSSAQRQSVSAAGRMVLETLWLWLRPVEQPLGDRYVRWSDTALPDALAASGRPILLLTPHMGSFEVCARGWAERYGATNPMTALYRPSKNAWLRRLQETARARPAMSTAPANLAGVRQMLRALKRGEVVGLLPDQVPPAGQGVWAPFFGRDAYTMTLAAKLATQTGAEVLVLRGERLPAGRGWCIHPSRLDVALPAGADEAAMRAGAAVINRTMETTILTDPGQYLWAYNRYKAPRAAEAVAAEVEPR